MARLAGCVRRYRASVTRGRAAIRAEIEGRPIWRDGVYTDNDVADLRTAFSSAYGLPERYLFGSDD